MRNKLLAVLLLGAGSVFGAQISIGIRIGPPPPLRVVRVLPRAPGPDFFWVGGYWYPEGLSYVWHAGYWTRPPYAGAIWVKPRYEGARYFEGYWNGPHGRISHDHHSDRAPGRDVRESGRGGRGGRGKGH